MFRRGWFAGSMFVAVFLIPAMAGDAPKTGAGGVYVFQMQSIDGNPVKLADYKGKVLLVVNVASECGLTPQYKNLEAIHRKFKDRGLRVLGIPANNFGAQEPGTNEQIKSFCTGKYDVTFDLFAKVSVKGDDTCDLYNYLTATDAGHEFGGEIPWNFTKFLVDREGKLVARFEPRTLPDDTKVTEAIEKALGPA